MNADVPDTRSFKVGGGAVSEALADVRCRSRSRPPGHGRRRDSRSRTLSQSRYRTRRGSRCRRCSEQRDHERTPRRGRRGRRFSSSRSRSWRGARARSSRRWVGSDGRGGDRSRAHTGLLVPAQARAGSASRKQKPALPATSPRASGVEPQPSSNGPTGHDRSTAGADVRELSSNRKKSSKSTPGQMRSAECAGAGKPGQQPDETGELNMARWAFDPTDEGELNMARVALVVRLQGAAVSTLQ